MGSFWNDLGLKINYHFRNTEKSRNSFNIISENNEQVGNVYNTYQKIIPNKIVNIMSFIQKIINIKAFPNLIIKIP